jgi:hypothetical protein
MKVSGFTIVRNAVKFDYPIVEAITSILPLCDEIVVAVGQSEDTTLDLVRSINSTKIRIIETVWDEGQREGGRTFALETDKAFRAIAPDADWGFYIQADEVVHEKYHGTIREAMLKYKDDAQVEGLLFNYRHFYGSYDYIGESWRWYRREIRVVRNSKQIFSYKDAQGFRKLPNDKLNVKLVDAFVFHYGWVKDPRTMHAKMQGWLHFYNDDRWIEQHATPVTEFDFSTVDSLAQFSETHPAVMKDRIHRLNWKFDHDLSLNRLTSRERAKRFISRLLGYRIGEYKNYRIV